jgi:hypothetical protein
MFDRCFVVLVEELNVGLEEDILCTLAGGHGVD